MVNTRTDADLSAAVQNALQALLPQIRAEIREEFHTSSRPPSDAGGNPPSVTIHTWLKRFNKQNPHSFEKAIAPVDAKNWISHMEKIFDVMGCEDAFKTRLVVYKFEGNALAWWKAYKQAKGGDAWLITVTWADFKNVFFDLLVSSEQLLVPRRSRQRTFSGVFAGLPLIISCVCRIRMQKSGDRHQPTSQQRSHRNHSHNNDRHGSDRRSGGDNHHSNNNYSGSHAANTSGTITGTLSIYGHAVFVQFDTGATHFVISSAFASRVTTTPTLLD
nr:hypothetical protein [Tanacetum cinerariifolium]